MVQCFRVLHGKCCIDVCLVVAVTQQQLQGQVSDMQLAWTSGRSSCNVQGKCYPLLCKVVKVGCLTDLVGQDLHVGFSAQCQCRRPRGPVLRMVHPEALALGSARSSDVQRHVEEDDRVVGRRPVRVAGAGSIAETAVLTNLMGDCRAVADALARQAEMSRWTSYAPDAPLFQVQTGWIAETGAIALQSIVAEQMLRDVARARQTFWTIEAGQARCALCLRVPARVAFAQQLVVDNRHDTVLVLRTWALDAHWTAAVVRNNEGPNQIR
jgi:hypothetical protein